MKQSQINTIFAIGLFLGGLILSAGIMKASVESHYQDELIKDKMNTLRVELNQLKAETRLMRLQSRHYLHNIGDPNPYRKVDPIEYGD